MRKQGKRKENRKDRTNLKGKYEEGLRERRKEGRMKDI